MASLDTIGGIHYEMMRRCYNPKCPMYKTYGAVGIEVCEEWHDREKFREWAKKNGYTKGLRINRIDSKKNYTPENCVFGTKNSKSSGIAEKSREIRKHRDIIKKISGVPKNYSKTRIYGIYNNMISRCERSYCSSYKYYGEKGIRVCDEWKCKDGFFHFYKWATENGYTDNLTIDRKDNSKGYSPENCRWITQEEQMRNRVNTIRYNYNGFMLTTREIADLESVDYAMLHYRLKEKKMDIEKAIAEIRTIKRSKLSD